MNNRDRTILLMKLRGDKHKDIADKIGLSIPGVDAIVYGEAFKKELIAETERRNTRKNTSQNVRTSRVIERMLEAVETRLDESVTADEALRMMDKILDLSKLIEPSQEETGSLSGVIRLPAMQSTKEFNSPTLDDIPHNEDPKPQPTPDEARGVLKTHPPTHNTESPLLDTEPPETAEYDAISMVEEYADPEPQ